MATHTEWPKFSASVDAWHAAPIRLGSNLGKERPKRSPALAGTTLPRPCVRHYLKVCQSSRWSMARICNDFCYYIACPRASTGVIRHHDDWGITVQHGEGQLHAATHTTAAAKSCATPGCSAPHSPEQ